MKRTIDMELDYQPMIDYPPITAQQMYSQACSGDKITIDTWRETWIKNYKSCAERFGDMSERSYGKLHGIARHGGVICLASGPSLKESLPALRDNQNSEHPVIVISTLHNYALLKDEGIKVDYYLSLDAGDIVIDDTTEFGTKDKEYYWNLTSEDKLIAYVASPPTLFDKWKGEVFLFNCLLPEAEIRKTLDDIQPLHAYISSGGNAGGAVLYTGKAIFGANTVMLCGYDFCFSYDKKFHSVDTKYDSFKGNGVGTTVRHVDVYGNSRHSWPSYMNFKFWTDWVTMNVPGQWVNCSEGLLGAYAQGNIRTMKYCTLAQALEPFRIADEVTVNEMGPNGSVLKKIKTKEIFGNPKGALPITMF